MEHIPCLLCGVDDAVAVVRQKDLLYGKSGPEWTVVRCRRCGLMYLNPRPDASEIHTFYPDEWFVPWGEQDQQRASHAWPGGVKGSIKRWLLQAYYGYPDTGAFPVRLLKKVCLFPEYLQRILRGKDSLPFLGSCRLLDVGCGRGGNLATCARLGWDVRGIDISPVAVEEARKKFGDRIHAGTLEDCPFVAETFDIILLNHTLEHVHNPVSALKKAWELLAPHGMVVIVVPNARSFESWLFGRWWFPWELPRHLFHFDAASLQHLLQRADFMPVRKTTGKGSLFFMASLEYALAATGRSSIPLRKLLERCLVRPLAIVLGLLGYGTELVFHAVKVPGPVRR